jgi:addiction module HigA family antidote
MKNSELKPIHPGETLRTEYLEPLNISLTELSQGLQVKLFIIQELITERSCLTVDLAYRLYLYFGTSARYWLNLQRDYDLAVYPTKETLQKQIQPYP